MRIAFVGAAVLVGGLAVLLQLRENASPEDAESTSRDTVVGTADSTDDMAIAARAFLEALTDAQRAVTQFSFVSAERTNWHYVPRRRKGLPLADMTAEQENAADDLLRSALSEAGYDKTTGVVELEGILRRDAEQYFLTIFGFPGDGEPWGWRFEGHHLSLNFSSITDSLMATTPLFMGANPAEVASGPRAGLRVLGEEEDLGRSLLASLDAAQQARAIISRRAPRDIITGADRTARLEAFEGLRASAMTDEQRDVVWVVIETYVESIREAQSAERLAQLRETHPDSLFFAWAGGSATGEGHYYRIHAPTLLIEYDNTQGGANHIHTVWRDSKNDFGDDWLRAHYEAHPHD